MTRTHQNTIVHVCPDCGQVRRLKPSDARKTYRCRRCHCRRIAPLGFAATAQARGRDFAIYAAAQKRRQQPSSVERQVEAALAALPGIVWEREVAVERTGCAPYFVDFVVGVDARRIALEVNGAYAHRNDGTYSCQRAEMLAQRFDALIVLTEDTVKRTSCLAATLQQLIACDAWKGKS